MWIEGFRTSRNESRKSDIEGRVGGERLILIDTVLLLWLHGVTSLDVKTSIVQENLCF